MAYYQAKEAEKELDARLREMSLSGFDSVDSDALTRAAEEAQTQVTWRKVAPFFAMVLQQDLFDGEQSVGEVLEASLILWTESQPKVHRILLKDNEEAHLERG